MNNSTTFIYLSRAQLATTAAFHMTFPALTVGLSIFLVICCTASARPNNIWVGDDARAAVEQLSRDIGMRPVARWSSRIRRDSGGVRVHAGVDRP
jgi:Cytochrome bd terminal oxidase subunit I